MRYVSLFSGVEAATLAWEPLGWEPLAFCDNAAFPSAVLAARYPDVPNLGDITKVDWRSYRGGAVELVVGGSPCQSFSVSGSRDGLDGPSGLMWEYVRAVQEVVPEWCVWENVPGALSSTGGEDFGCLLRALDGVGYGLAWRVLDAQFFGVAQRRRRVFLVGRLGDVRGPCEVLFEPDCLRWDNPTGRDKRQELARAVGRGAQGAGGGLIVFKWSQGHAAGSMPVAGPGEASCTLMANGTQLAVLAWQADDTANAARGTDEDAVGTLRATGGVPPSVAYATNQRGELRLDGGDGSTVGVLPASRSGKQMQLVGSAYELRYLTPRECERLQGMPDDWTRVPYRGRPAEECPDTPRWQAIGNSMAVPVMRWIGERIERVAQSRSKAAV